MTPYTPDALDPETVEHIGHGCPECDLNRKPRWYVCPFHDGYDQGVADMKAILHEYH